MIFRKKLNINGKIVDINLSNLKFKKKNIFIFGSPLGLNLRKLQKKIFLMKLKI